MVMIMTVMTVMIMMMVMVMMNIAMVMAMLFRFFGLLVQCAKMTLQNFRPIQVALDHRRYYMLHAANSLCWLILLRRQHQ